MPKDLINNDLYKAVNKLYGKEFYFIFRNSMQIISYGQQLPIKEEILSIIGTKIRLAEIIAIAIQNQIIECQQYLDLSTDKKIIIRWSKAIETHLDILDKLIDYISKEKHI